MDRAADPLALETLLAHREWVRRVAGALARDGDSADDIEQTAWVAALESPPATTEAPRAWLGTVMRRAASKLRRGEKRRARREEAVARREATTSVADSVAAAESHERLVRAVLGLPEPYRATVVLRYFDGLPPREIAARMEVSADTVQTRLRRARELLRDALDDGERGRWRLVLLPLLRGRNAAPTAAAAAGGLAMAFTLSKIAVGGAAALLVWMLVRDGAAPAARAVEPIAAQASAAAATPPAPRPRRDVASVADGAAAPADAGSAAAAPEKAQLRVLVRRGTAPCAGAVVLAFRDDKPVARGTTDAQGALRLALPAGGASIVVVPVGSPPVEAAGSAPGECVIEAPAGGVVAGIVRVNGAAPRTPVKLALRTPSKYAEARPSLTPDALTELEPDLFDALMGDELRVSTDAAGRFRFEGVPAGVVSSLSSINCRFADGSEELPGVEAPREGLVLDFVELPTARGRVVQFVGGPPVPRARVTARVDTDGDARSCCDLCFSADSEGRFELVGLRPESKFISFEVTGRDGDGRRAVEIPAALAFHWELGDVALAATRTVAFDVRDEDDRPVAGAAAIAVDEGKTSCTRSDAAGRGTVVVPFDAKRLRIAAPGFAPRDVETSGDAPVVVRLARAAQLVVSIHGLFHLRIESDQPLFLGEDGGLPEAALRAADCPCPDQASHAPDGRSSALFESPSTPLVLDGLREDVPIQLVLLDATDAVAATREVRLEAGSRRRVILEPTSPARALRGIVRGPDGAPRVATLSILEPARADGEAGGRRSWKSGVDGRFEIGPLCAEKVVVLVQADGLAPLVERRAPVKAGRDTVNGVPQTDDDVNFDLALGRSARVLVADEAGEPVAGAVVAAQCALDGWPEVVEVQARERGRGEYELVGLPPVECRVVVTAGERRVEAVAPREETEVRVVVKASGD